ncbi:tonB-dependent receptor plug [Bacteroides sp. CAG:754]|nr:tonB-dependent receptor plug [Bacteroides sp. CAG:754]
MKVANITKRSSIYGLLALSAMSFYPVSSAYAEQMKHNDTTMEVNQKKVRITGVVRDENGDVVPGASVIVRGTNNGTVTNIDGQFSLNVEAGNTLVVSFVGYTNAELKITQDKSNYTVDLKPASQLLDEVVVTGYQTISKERATGSYAIMTPKDIEGKLQTNILDRMEGKVAGLDLRVSADKDVVPSIRGISTLVKGKRTPLYVVDGIPYEGELDAINPADIVNVTVLKDATAASIYGARSANGVIVITTRSGEKGKTRVSYNGSVKFTPLPSHSYMNLTSSGELVDLMQELFGYYHNPYQPTDARSTNEIYLLMYKREAGEIATDAELQSQLDVYRNRDSYSQIKDELLRKAEITHQHNISFSGGSDIYKYALSANYQEKLPYEKEQSNQRIGFNLKNQFDFFKWLQVNVGIINSNYKADYDNGFQGFSNLYSKPYRMLRNEDGTPAIWTMNRTQESIDGLVAKGLLDETYRPLDEIDKAHYNNEKKYQNLNISAKFKIMPELNLSIYYQNENTSIYNSQYYDVNSYTMKSTINDATVIKDGTITNHIPVGGRLSETWNKNKSYTFRVQADFNKEFGRHDVQVLVGAERRQVKTQSSYYTKWGYDPQSLTWKSFNELQLGTGISGTEALYGSYYFSGPYDKFTDTDDRYVSFYGNASYSLDHRLSATGSIRIDQSNLFGTDPKYQYRPLWSAGLHYVALENWQWIDRLAIRGTYGINGNIAKDSGPYMIATTNSRPNSYTNEYYSYISTPPNPTLRWEKTGVFNLGVDFNILNNRLSGTIEFYNKKTVDLLGQRQTDPTSGWGSLQLNYGQMYNRGVEVTLHSENIRTHSFSWSSDFIFSYNKNKLTQIENSGTSAQSYFGSLQNREGYPMNSIFVVRYAGLDKEGLPQAYKADGTIVNSYALLEPEDLVHVGTTTPPYSASLSNRIAYKGFDLDFMFIFYGGHKLRDVAASSMFTMYPVMNSTSAIDRDRLNFWRQPGDENDPNMAPAFLYGNSRSGQVQYLWSAADKHIQKGDYIKLRDLSIGYTFPKVWIKKFFMQNLRVNLQIQNLWYWAANDKNLDPEVWSGTSLSPSRGQHIPATYTIGLSANF